MASRSSTTLDYQRPQRARRLKRLIRWLACFIAAAALIFVGGSFTPFDHWRIAYICTTCGKMETQSQWRVCGVPYRWRHDVLSTEYSSIYDRLVATPHQHSWVGYARVHESGTAWGNSAIGEGGPDEPAIAIRDALTAMEIDFAALPTLQRQSIYSRLQQCKTADEVQVGVNAEIARLRQLK